MKHANIHEALHFDEENIVIDELLETPFVREIRIAMYAHQVMRDHQSEHPVTIEVCEGAVTLSTENAELILPRGEVIGLDGGVKHHIEALQESVLRLSIFTSVETGGL
jgi:quercetin dioxygenase-like cupin family protein